MAEWDQWRRQKLQHALNESALSFARYAGMKARVEADPPRAAVGHMPFAGHRTVAEIKAG